MEFSVMNYRLDEVLKIKYGKNQKKVLDKNGKYPILGTGGVMALANEFLYDKPSVLIGRKGSIGKVKYIDEPFWTVDTLFYTEIDENIVIPKYLYYYLSQIDFNYYNEGTTIPSLRTETLNGIQIDIPSIEIQAQILYVLNNIDKKIVNNNKIISNLEQISQILFKRWFIDFEFPNEEGQPYKSSGGEMVESELGEIPKGWEVKRLKEITTHYKETFNPQKFRTEKVYHYSLPAFDKEEYPSIDATVTIKSNKWFIKDYCVLFSKMNPNTPRIWLVNEKYDMPNVASSEFVVLKNNSEDENFFIYNVCKDKNFKDYLCANTTGSTNSRQRVTPTIALDYKMAIDNNLRMEFEKCCSSNGKLISDLREQIRALEQLRDTLLPKLLSGEIEIPDDLEV